MTIRIAINGYGRIGRNILRALYEYQRRDEFEIVAINAIGDNKSALYLTKHDSTHGPFKEEIYTEGEDLIVKGDRIQILQERDPINAPWKELNIDVVFECTGLFTQREKAAVHLTAGAKKVLISAPGENADITVVYGVNHQQINESHKIVSNASCTTNCLAPIAKILHEAIGIETGVMVTTHAYTNDQMLLDGAHTDFRRGRSAAHSIIPSKTGAAKAVGLVLPELAGKLDGSALRIPVINVSLLDLTILPLRPVTSAHDINVLLKKAAEEGPMKNILAYSDEDLVSVDFNHHPASAIVEASQTRILGKLVKVMAWYDNEWGFSNRMLDVAKAMFL